jgi:D-alanyl-D-alanine carboxypeptidase
MMNQRNRTTSTIQRCFIVTISTLFLLATQGIATSLAKPQTAIADRIGEIDQLLASTYKPTDPGAVVLIAQNGKPLLRKAYGMADIEKNIALKAEDVFRIGSITKPFTAIAVMLLEEDGKLKVEDEITRHLPDYPTQGHKVTIAHLLTHTSGIAIYTDMASVRNAITPTTTPSEVINLFKNAPMMRAPGEQYDYNNSGYYLLGAVIEKASGMSYADFLAKRIFIPLGMNNTAYEGAERGAKRVTGYRSEEGRFTVAPMFSANRSFASGGLVSTADDLLRWQNAMMQEKLLKPATWKRVFTPARLNNGSATEYGNGWTLRKLRGQAMREHSGVIAGFQAIVMMLPSKQLSVIFLTNQQTRQNTARRLGEQMAAIALGKPFPDLKPITLSDDALAQFEGVYQLQGKPARTLSRVGTQLRQQFGTSQSMMQPYKDNEFFQPDGAFTRFRFERDAEGKFTRMVRIDSGDEEEIYTRVADLPAPAIPAK